MRTALEMKTVDSSSIKAIGYDEDRNVLAVQFSSGGTYHYHGVSKEAYESLLGAPSIGKHFHSVIKPQYAGQKV